MRNGELALLFSLAFALFYMALMVVVLRLGLRGVQAELGRIAAAAERLTYREPTP